MGVTPPTEAIANAATVHHAATVLLSVSAASKSRESLVLEQLGRLRTLLPPKAQIVLGGSGAPTVQGLTSFHSLWALQQWAKANCL